MPPNFIVFSNNDYKMFHWHLTSYTQPHIYTYIYTIEQQQIDNTKKIITYRLCYLYIFLLIIKAHTHTHTEKEWVKMAIYSFQSV